jgi:2-(1,2-epoxy-1,2-dihydrophenyl)acetyl-CoA isomerase
MERPHMPDVLETLTDGIATLTLNRPDRFNAFDVPFITEFRQAFERTIKRNDVDGLVISGAGRAFCAGGDVSAMREHLDKNPKQLFLDLTGEFHPVIQGIRRTPKPVVAAVNGPAAGGGYGLALACDLRIASTDARFQPAYSRLGIVPDGGLTFFLPRMVGQGHAQRIILRDDVVKADEALRMGLVDRVVAPADLLATAVGDCRKLADQPPDSFRFTKELLAHSMMVELDAQLDRERRRIALAGSQPALKEGVLAFFEKREPDFRGRKTPVPKAR